MGWDSWLYQVRAVHRTIASNPSTAWDATPGSRAEAAGGYLDGVLPRALLEAVRPSARAGRRRHINCAEPQERLHSDR